MRQAEWGDLYAGTDAFTNRQLARMSFAEPHCDTHKQFEYDCMDCVDASQSAKGVNEK